MPVYKQAQAPTRGRYSQAQAYGATTDNGVQGGFGLQSGLIGNANGLHGSSDLLTANGFAGGREESDGSVTRGFGIGGKVAGINLGYGQQGQGNFADLQVDALGADAGASFNAQQGANLGATAYLAQAAITAGNIGTGNHDSESRIGLAAGVGAAGRLHWNDSDGDGLREYGFGADIGPLTFDVKSEDPMRDWIPGASIASDLLGYEGNLTQDVGSGLSAAGSAIGSAASATASFIGDIFSGW